MEWLIKKIYTVGDVQKKVFYRSRLSEWLIRKTIYTVTNVQNIVSYRSSDLTSLCYNVNVSEVYQKGQEQIFYVSICIIERNTVRHSTI